MVAGKDPGLIGHPRRIGAKRHVVTARLDDAQCLALLLLQNSRRSARITGSGDLIPLEEQAYGLDAMGLAGPDVLLLAARRHRDAAAAQDLDVADDGAQATVEQAEGEVFIGEEAALLAGLGLVGIPEWVLPALAQLPGPLALIEVTLGELHDEPFLLLRDGHCFRETAVAACKRARVRPKIIFESGQFSSILSMVCAGLGVSIIPAMALEKRPGCQFVPLADGRATRAIGAVTLHGRSLSRVQQAFLAHLTETNIATTSPNLEG